ncbi:MAG: glycosyl hydrolase family 8 [Candidatus Gastranaerophilales bacterium]|nr:glycosyl hydrolase family 8 [Candidatus Gastranaerophilales bacterium]
MKINFLLLLTLIFFALIFIFTFKANGNPDKNDCLITSYEIYKKNFMSKDGRIIDYDKNNITTSEGQSYIMLQSLAVDDKPAFDLAWTWTKNNLQRSDKLFAWLWGKNSEGKYKILDYNSASDADIDIAFALLIAYEQWGNYKYLEEAKTIICSIWDKETKKIGSRLVLMPGVKQTSEEKIEINPSYFSPYQFRFFQKYDDLHNWEYLIDSSYYYLNTAMAQTITGLPPNWFLIKDGQIIFEYSQRSDFSYDAIRVFARIYLDYERTGEKRALTILEKSNIFIEQWRDFKTFYVNYQSNGELRDKDKFVGSISVLLPVISLYDKKVADEIYRQEVKPFIQNKTYWGSKKGYYSKNLTWFGLFLYENQLKGCRIKGK